MADAVEKAFNIIDTDKSGFISKDELHRAIEILGEHMSWDKATIDKETEKIMKKADGLGNKDGKISLDEFRKANEK